MKPKKSKDLCQGCYNDFYNGRKNVTQEGCWSFKQSRVVKRVFVHMDQVPPWRNSPEYTLDCHNRQRFITVEPNHPNITVDGEEAG